MIRTLDASVRVTADEPMHGILREAFADLVEDAPTAPGSLTEVVWGADGEGRWLLTVDGNGYVSAGDIGGTLAEAIIGLNRRAAESVADRCIPLHAGMFAVDGRGVAVTGRSGAGKSTLVAAAALEGHGFVADEVCAIGDDFVVRPYHRPIGLRTAGAAAIGVEIPVHDDGRYGTVYPWAAGRHTSLAGPTPLTLIALLVRRPGPVEIERLTPVDALVRLSDLTLGAEAHARSTFRRLERLAREMRVVELRYEDSRAAVERLAERATR